MALGFYFAPASMTSALYDECIEKLAAAGAAHPAGRVYHASFGAPDKLMVFDVWTSQAEFDVFGQTLMPILAGLGIDPGQPSVMPIHNVVVPPAPKPAAKKAAKKAPKKAAKKAVKKAAKKPAKKGTARRK